MATESSKRKVPKRDLKSRKNITMGLRLHICARNQISKQFLVENAEMCAHVKDIKAQ